MAVNWDCKRATAACRSVFGIRSPEDKLKDSRMRQALQRVRRKTLRRAQGIVLRSPSANLSREEIAASYANVHLRGFGALRRVFPDISRKFFIDALRLADDVPAARRGVIVARAALASGLQEPITDSTLQWRAVAGMRNADEACGRVIRLSRTRSIAGDAVVSSRRLQDPLSNCSLRDVPTLTRLVSAPAIAVSRAVGNAADQGVCAGSQSLQDVSSTEPSRCAQHFNDDEGLPSYGEDPWGISADTALHFDDDPVLYSHRAWRREQRGFEKGMRKPCRHRVKDTLLQAPIPAQDLLLALEVARKKAARVEDSDAAHELENERQHDPWDSWGTMQVQFLNEYGDAIRRELGHTVELKRLEPDHDVQARFLDSCRRAQSMPLPAYHGTLSRNIQSISQKGLIVPGRNGVRVLNGSAHGVGIYTAVLGASSLSLSFCDSPNMFVCGVCDAPDQSINTTNFKAHGAPKWSRGHRQHRAPASRMTPGPTQRKMWGRLEVKKETSEVIHVGSAMVVFRENRVAPLFRASGVRHRRFLRGATTANGVQAVIWPTTRNPNPRDDLVATRQVAVPGLGVVVWQPPEADSYRPNIKVKRRIVRKEKDLLRKAERERKLSHWSDVAL